jgi:hypothetical protein
MDLISLLDSKKIAALWHKYSSFPEKLFSNRDIAIIEGRKLTK